MEKIIKDVQTPVFKIVSDEKSTTIYDLDSDNKVVVEHDSVLHGESCSLIFLKDGSAIYVGEIVYKFTPIEKINKIFVYERSGGELLSCGETENHIYNFEYLVCVDNPHEEVDYSKCFKEILYGTPLEIHTMARLLKINIYDASDIIMASIKKKYGFDYKSICTKKYSHNAETLKVSKKKYTWTPL